MSKSISQLILFIVFIIGFVFIFSKKHNIKNPQNLKSISLKKSLSISIHKKKPMRHTSKLKSPIQIKIIRTSKDKSSTAHFTLTATISSTNNLDQSDYKWVVPNSIESLNGSLKGVLEPSLLQNGAYSTSIQLKSLDQKNHIIQFIVRKNKNQKGAYSQTLSFHTKIQDEVLNSLKVLKANQNIELEAFQKIKSFE